MSSLNSFGLTEFSYRFPYPVMIKVQLFIKLAMFSISFVVFSGGFNLKNARKPTHERYVINAPKPK